MPSRIKHIATMSQNSPRLRSFYELLFNLKRPAAETSHDRAEEVGKAFGYPVLASKRVARPFSGTVWGVDGNIGLSFNRRRRFSGQVWTISVWRSMTSSSYNRASRRNTLTWAS